MNMRTFFPVMAALGCLCAAVASASVPSQINFQGMLTDTSGNPIDRTIDRMVFSIYADSVAGTSLWNESHSSVQVTDGLFRVILGSSNPIPSSLFNGSVRWISFMAYPDAQDLSPRQPLVTVPYGYRAGLAETVQVPLHLTGDTASAAIIWGTNTTGTGYGIKGDNSSSGNYGMLGGSYYGAFGRNLNANRGYLGHNDYGVWGMHNATGNFGYIGDTNYGVYGEHNSGPTGYLGGSWAGAFGSSANSDYLGYLGFASCGVYGYCSAGPWGLLGNDSIGVYGTGGVSTGGAVYGKYSSTGPFGWLGRSSYGVYGQHNNGHYGYIGGSAVGAYGRNSNDNYGYMGGSSYGVYGNSSSSNGYGGYFYAGGSGGTGIYARGGSGGKAGIFRGNVVLQSASTGTAVLELGEGLDYAEGFEVTKHPHVTPGTVLSIDPDHPGKLTISNRPHDPRVVAGAKGLGSGVRLGVDRFDCDVALAGRVFCNVDASETSIEPGDFLTTSNLPGYAMKATDYSRAEGAILGKAMERLEKGQKGLILVLVTLQ